MKLPSTGAAISAAAIIITVVTGSVIPPVARSVAGAEEQPDTRNEDPQLAPGLPNINLATAETPRGHRDIHIDDPIYNLSDCTMKYLPHTARVMTGIEKDDHSRKYTHCSFIRGGENLVDYECLCKGGDGEGSAIMSAALLSGHVWLACGWEHAFGTSSSCLCL